MPELLAGFAERLRTCASRKTCHRPSWGSAPACTILISALISAVSSGVRPGQAAIRSSGDTLKQLADALDVTSDYLLEGAADDAARANFADREPLKQFQKVERLLDEDKRHQDAARCVADQEASAIADALTELPMQDAQVLLEMIQALPPERVAEIEDFVAFITARERERTLVRDAAATSAPAFAVIWNNPDDDAYNDL